VIIDGDFIGATSITSSLLIVRGNVGRVTGVTKSIILATGNFEGATVCHESFLQVNNTWIRFTGSNNSVFVKTQVRTTGNTNAVVLDADKGPLQLLKFSERKADDKVAWGKEVNSLAVAIMPTEQKDRFLIRWKNVGDVAFALPMVRLNRDVSDPQRDDLLDHVFLKGPDGKLANARKYPPVRAGGPPRVLMNAAVLGAGKGHEEIIDLWTYVERPANSGRFQLSIEFENPESRRAILFNEFKTWSGKVQSNSLDVDLAK
jgi:hypothetical protein